MSSVTRSLESRRWYPFLVAILATCLGVAIGKWTETFPLHTNPDAISQPIWSWISGATGWMLGYFLGGQRISWKRLLVAGIVAAIYAAIVPFTLCPPPRFVFDWQGLNSEAVRNALNNQEMLVAWGSSSLFFFISYPGFFKSLGRSLARRGYDDGED